MSRLVRSYREFWPPNAATLADAMQFMSGDFGVIDRIRNTLLEIIREEAVECPPNEMPHEAGVYFVTDRSGNVVYVGVAVDLYNRWSKHPLRRECADGGAYGLRYKTPDLENFGSKELEEAAFIAFLRPRLNRKIICDVPPHPMASY